MINNKCINRLTIISIADQEAEDFGGKNNQGTYIECPMTSAEILESSCYFGACYYKGENGRTTVGLVESLLLRSLDKQETGCSGTTSFY